ncbi:heat shock protein 9/12-domain-containing protein [Aspergillus californicus]
MSDVGRKDFYTKAKEEITPDASKSTQDKVMESFTDTTDRVSREMQPDSQKGAGQQAFDKAQRTKDNEVHGGTPETVGEKIKNAVGLGGNNQ